MHIEHKTVDKTLYVALSGELDESCAAVLRTQLDSLMLQPNIKRVVLDLANVSFMDSTGIGMLIGRYKLLHARGVPIHLSSPQSTVDKILLLSGIYEIMPKISV